jgi:hypothetical protein
MLILYGIAIAFLIFFIIRIIFPKFVPHIKRFFLFVIRIIQNLLRLIADTLSASIYLLLTRTVKVIGSVLVLSIIVTIILAYRKVDDLKFLSLWETSKGIFLHVYVIYFFVITLTLGLIRTLRKYYFNRKYQKMNRKKQARNYNI